MGDLNHNMILLREWFEQDDVEKVQRFVVDLEEWMLEQPEVKGPDDYVTLHSFAEGQYIRETHVPAGDLFITRIHRFSHAFFLMRGKCSILTEKGISRVEAPFHMITPAGTRRVIYAFEDLVGITVHTTDKTDIDEIEDYIYVDKKRVLPTKGEILCLE